MVTDKDYKRIADRVYDVDSGKVANPVKKGNTVAGGKYKVLQVEDNTDNGMQAMAVAPVDKNGHVDTSQVVIAYAGTNKSDIKDIETDSQSLGLGRDKLQMRSGLNSAKVTDSQFKTAQAFAKKVAKKYPKAEITTTGHSLGESLAMYVSVKKGYNNVGFNGPDIHNMLSDKEIADMKKHKGQFRNYRNPHDKIGNITGNETETAIYVDKDNKSGLTGDHSLSNWQFDNDGNLVDKNGNVADVTHVYDEVESMVSGYMGKDFKAMKSKLGADGYSGHEKIFLDYLSASAVASGLGSAAQIGYESIKGQADAAGEEAEQLYKSLTSDRPASVNKLTDDEILAVYAEEGITYDYMVTKVKDHFDKKTTKASSLSEEFANLGGQIETGMQGLIDEDNSLGGEISGWMSGM
ncbi:triacylglycerol lipase [Streptococcus dentasini]